jgi:hypothetical protein
MHVLITLLGCSDNLSSAHPYEEPSYQVYKLEDLGIKKLHYLGAGW